MRTTRRAPRAATAGAVFVAGAVLLGSGACTPDEPDPPDTSPRPLPTAFEGERPPGVEGDPVRHLHGPGADGPDILDDDMGVRIQALGDAFLISSNSEERHLLQRASDGETLWQGEQRVDGFTRTADGGPALRLTGEGGASVVDDEGETVWEGGGRDVYVPGFSVHRPEEWSPEDPHGAFAVSGPDGGDPLWEYTFEEPDDSAPDPERMGVPVAADDGVLLLDDGAGLLQARDPEDPGEPLWSVTGDDSDLLGDGAVPRPAPQVVGHYALPAPEDGSTEEDSPGDEGSDGASDEASEGASDGAEESPTPSSGDDTAPDGSEATVRGVLVRWTRPEEPSLLSMHDLHTGEVVWTLQEPGTNPADPDFAPDPLAGAVLDPGTGTLMLPQAGGRTPMVALDTATGDLLWEFEGQDERALSVAFAAGGFVYADARGADDTDSTQVVLEAPSKDEAAEGLDSFVEAVSADGYAVVVHDRQRFVFAPPDAPDGD
ncbi:PQQ-binding-like beta-propeller repeat protein [Nocardiopsis sp. RSe5-2]|uniref:PQQ-binding-like beta-propeller repeat protein n=1 Tax=Nocardiopsis endophytica TaxID=3018445 RepID=A0ABT4UAX3_9ACTN|nr:PQQ-binding-like beta-propeller repeat protein [Nocardiopsis endophytica]MDA2814121.1 PQQ-binding-like beta-propeller repeat protein [Nocardiopsis endophytica]